MEEPLEPLVEDELCDFCGGDGYVFTDGDGGEGNRQFGVGTMKCLCQYEFNEDDQD